MELLNFRDIYKWLVWFKVVGHQIQFIDLFGSYNHSELLGFDCFPNFLFSCIILKGLAVQQPKPDKFQIYLFMFFIFFN